MDVANTAITIATLIIGALLSQMQTSWGASRSARRDARELLAEQGRYLWNKSGENDYIELQVYLNRLYGHLRSARVPMVDARRAIEKLDAFWMALTEGQRGWESTTASFSRIIEMNEALTQRLDDSWWRRRRAGAVSGPKQG